MQEQTLSLIRGITITPPLLGRITMGHTETKGGDDDKGRPQKDDHFTITTLRQNPDRSWEVHPIQATLVKGKDKLLQIPVKIAYNDPTLTLNNAYSCFDTEKKTVGRVLCTGDGVKARRSTAEGVQTIACPRPEACEYGQQYRCKNMTRAYFQIDGQDDDLGMFVLRSAGRNTLDALAGRLARLAGLSGGQLAGMPLMLAIKVKTTAQSFRKPFWYADLVFRPGMGMIETVQAARQYQKHLAEAGLSLEEMEGAIREGLANGDFADEIEDIDEWVSDADLVAMAGERQRQSGGLKGLDDVLSRLAAAGATGGPAGVGQISAGGQVQPELSPAPSLPKSSPDDRTATSVSPQTLGSPPASKTRGKGTSKVAPQPLPEPTYATLATPFTGPPALPPTMPVGGLALSLSVPMAAPKEPMVPVL